MKNLSQYRKDNSITLREFAKKCGLSPSYVCEIEGGSKFPSLNAARKIHQATDGEVDVSSWLKIEVG